MFTQIFTRSTRKYFSTRTHARRYVFCKQAEEKKKWLFNTKSTRGGLFIVLKYTPTYSVHFSLGEKFRHFFWNNCPRVGIF